MQRPAVEPENEGATPSMRQPVGEELSRPAKPRVRRTRLSHAEVQEELPALLRAPSRRVFRLYCFSCGRSTESTAAPPRPGRCPTCGGTMLLELAAE
ncbi:MAG: hypothetical protein M3069_10050 [Chloroflexota bacterium]|nr:hypothetical protein [Chloroflexota bacterium]